MEVWLFWFVAGTGVGAFAAATAAAALFAVFIKPPASKSCQDKKCKTDENGWKICRNPFKHKGDSFHQAVAFSRTRLVLFCGFGRKRRKSIPARRRNATTVQTPNVTPPKMSPPI